MKSVYERTPHSIDLVYRQLFAARHALEHALGPDVSDATALALHNLAGIELLPERYRPDEDDEAQAAVERGQRVMSYADAEARCEAYMLLKAKLDWRSSK